MAEITDVSIAFFYLNEKISKQSDKRARRQHIFLVVYVTNIICN
jgi:hypothetical protein